MKHSRAFPSRIKPNVHRVLERFAALGIVMLVCVLVGAYAVTAYTRTGTIFPTAELFDGRATFRFFDVGQGDCALITYRGDAVLIDCGSGECAEETAETVRLYAPQIDYLILTHPHEDHMGGAAEIIEKLNVETVVLPTQSVEETFYSDATEAIAREKCNTVTPGGAAEFKVGGILIEVLDSFGEGEDNLNNASLVVRVTVDGTSVLFSGDAEKEEEARLLEKAPSFLDADYLKVGHHGSSTSTTVEYIEAISPSTAVISCGKDNGYGHPAPETLARLDMLGVEVKRTDKDGTVVLRGK